MLTIVRAYPVAFPHESYVVADLPYKKISNLDTNGEGETKWRPFNITYCFKEIYNFVAPGRVQGRS